MKKIIKNIFIKFQGLQKFQLFFDAMYRASIRGMNYGNGGDASRSGEDVLIERIGEFYKNTSTVILFDVGANAGNYSNMVHKKLGSKCIIHAFEPSLKTYELLKHNCIHIPHIQINNIGLGEMEETKILYLNYEGSAMASLYKRDLAFINVNMNETESIALSTVNKYCHIKNIERIHFLKLDIEGHEISALKGAKRMIDTGAIDFIQFEFGGCNIDSRTFFKDFFNLFHTKYSIYRIVKDGLVEMKGYRETYEIFTAVNYLAIRKEINF